MPTALVTGATGLVGAHIVERLLAEGWSVRALVRDVGRAGWLSRLDVGLVTGDVLDQPSFVRAAAGCDHVFHCAAAITARGGWRDFQRINVDGTRNAIAAASRAKARLLHLSSVAVYGPARYTPGGRTDERVALDQPIPEEAWYARSKRESERLVMTAHEAERVWATAVRPSVVYGPRDRQFVPRIARLLLRGIAPVVGTGGNTLAIVHAANVAHGAVLAVTSDVAGGEAYNLAHDFDVTAADFFRLAAEGLGRPVRTVRIPLSIARLGIGAIRFAAPLFPSRALAVAAASSVDFLGRDNPFSSELARTELGWAPSVTPEEGVPAAFRWWNVHR
ncbi:MAG TPA: NAD-dependent epimerase/dehydratase family protein [Gemmatimonadaceae bacterium]|nr:NAD-dependent epimerase/dehydratase family protein [Gemmatimonadaceae bacterium]